MRRLIALATLPCIACVATEDPTQLPPVSPLPSVSPTPTGPVPDTTYYADVLPLLERSCLSCHATGGIGQPNFGTPESASTLASLIALTVKSGRMPPFYASRDCNEYVDDPRLGPDEIATLERWAALGGPIGDPATAVHSTPPTPVTVRSDKVLDAGAPFDAMLMAQSDNYRCFQLDPQLARDAYVTGFQVVPGNLAIVHHVLAYVVEPAQLAELQRKDDSDPGLGYECFAGGVGIRGAIQNQIGSFVPGLGAQRTPPGYGLKIPAGSKIVMQVHYNLLNAGSAGSMDTTALHLELSADANLKEAQILPMVRRNLDIQADDPASVQQQELPLNVTPIRQATIYSLTGHMHMLGTRVRLEYERSDGSKICLLDIPNWDFNWQRDYRLKTPAVLDDRQGRLRITCVYDNSAANQPFVNGVQQTPRDVQWGESSLDEMCMTYLMFTTD
jgi:hypothetical protein